MLKSLYLLLILVNALREKDISQIATCLCVLHKEQFVINAKKKTTNCKSEPVQP